METAPRNCRFLSLVVVELVLNILGLFGGERIKPNFADKNFMDTQTFLNLRKCV